MLTTNNGFTFFKSSISRDESKTVETFYESSNRYELVPVSDITTDKGSDFYVVKKPPAFDTGDDSDGIITNYVKETDTTVLGCWSGLRSEMREMIRALVYALDILTEEISEMNYEQVHTDRAACYHAGWVEQSFVSMASADLSIKCNIVHPEDFICSKRTLDPEGTNADAIASTSCRSCDF